MGRCFVMVAEAGIEPTAPDAESGMLPLHYSAKYIIELDDTSHDRKDRKERDNFVDEVVESVGYKIIHVRAITDDIINQLQATVAVGVGHPKQSQYA